MVGCRGFLQWSQIEAESEIERDLLSLDASGSRGGVGRAGSVKRGRRYGPDHIPEVPGDYMGDAASDGIDGVWASGGPKDHVEKRRFKHLPIIPP